jgi:uncharacterized Zn finger protein
VSDPPADELRDYLMTLEPEELVRRLLELADRDEAALTALHAEAAVAAGTFDLKAFRKVLTAELRVSGYVGWRGAAEYANRVDGLVDLLEQLLAAGRADDVVVLAEHMMARLDTAMNRIDDSGGYLGSVVPRLQDVHHAACLAGHPDPRRLGVRLVELELKSQWEWFLDAAERYRDVLGEEGLAAYRARLEREWETVPQLMPRVDGSYHSHDSRRWTITHLRERLAKAEGNVDELVSVLARDLSEPFCFRKIADELEEADREREALVWLERGIAAFPPAGDWQLREHAIRAYLRDGQVEDAIALARRAFEAEPSSRTYGELRKATNGFRDAQALRESALETLRAADSPAGRNNAVRAQLEDGDVEGAWTDAQAGCNVELWRRLADARRADHPDDSLLVYRRLLERALEVSQVRAYEEAIDVLRAIRDTLAPAGRRSEFEAELARVREEQRRRPKLIAMLAAEKW